MRVVVEDAVDTLRMRPVLLGASSKACIGLAILIIVGVVAVSQGQTLYLPQYLVLYTSFSVVAVR